MGKKAWIAALTATFMLLVCGGPAFAQCVTISPYGGGGKGARGGGLPTSVGGSPPGYHVSPRGQVESDNPSAKAVHKPAKGFEVDGPPKVVKFKDGSTALVARPKRPGRLDAPFYNTPSRRNTSGTEENKAPAYQSAGYSRQRQVFFPTQDAQGR